MKKTRKAFTLVELLVVIAILAVLATVGIVGYTSFTKKAKESNDRSVVAQINLALQASEVTDGKPQTMYDALQVVEGAGFVVANLTPDTDGYDYVYDMKNNRFALMNKTTVVAEANDKSFEDGVNAWQFIGAGQTLSTSRSNYLKDGWSGAIAEVKTGIDCGNNASITSITYNGSTSGQTVVIRTKGDQCSLTINAANDDVNFYGYAREINVLAIKSTSLHIYGSTNTLAVTSGHVQVENTGIVFDVVQVGTAAEGTGASITNNGYIATTSLSAHTSEEAKAAATAQVTGNVGGDYEIGSLAQLEAFRDAVNSGNTFAGKTVKLSADITLKDGWKPIGEGARQVVNNGSSTVATLFAGTFDGQNHTISNLNNKGFNPTQNRFDAEKGCAYGLFALVGNGAEIKNVKLANVNIDFSGSVKGDSVAALVGYSENNLTITNVTVVSGSIKAEDGVAGIVGRVYVSKITDPSTTYTVTISNCTNNADITATDNKAAGIAAMAGDISSGNNKLSLTISDCSNTGHITAQYSSTILAYATVTRSNNFIIHNCGTTTVAGGNTDKVTITND